MIFSLVGIGLSLFVAALIAELALTLLKPQPVLRRVLANTPAMYVEGDVLPYVLIPGYRGRLRKPEYDTLVSINSRGFRGPEVRDSGEPRMMIIGDSMTFGYGMDDSDAYPAILDTLSTSVEVINGGLPGSSPGMYLAWLRAHGTELHSSAYLIGFFIGNDIDRADEIWAEVDTDGLPLRIESFEYEVVDNYIRLKKTRIGYRYPILRESHLFHLRDQSGHKQ